MTSETASPPAEHPALPRPRAHWLRKTLLAVAILLCGMVIGSGLTLRVLWVQVTAAIQNPAEIPQRISHRMDRVLDLTDEQSKRVEEILSREYQALAEIRREIAPRVQAELDKTRNDVAAALTPEQARKWQKRFDFLRKEWTPPLPEPPAPAGQ